MTLTKCARCHIRMDSQWASYSAVCMGISVFVRAVYYFGLTNLRDLGGFALVAQVIFPMVLAGGYLITIKGFRFNSPVLFGGLIGLYAVNYWMLMTPTTTGILGGILLVLTALIFTATGLGYLPNRIPVICLSVALMLFRVVFVDVYEYLLPLSQFHPVAYLPEASNLFGFLAVGLMAPALHVSPIASSQTQG